MKTPEIKRGEELESNPAFQITEVARLFRTGFDAKMKAIGLNRSQWWLIAFLCFFEGSTQQELAKVMDIGKAGLGKLVDRLEAEGLVKRTSDASDRRVSRLRLTPSATPIKKKIQRELDSTMQVAFSAFDAAEMATLLALLGKIKQSLDK